MITKSGETKDSRVEDQELDRISFMGHNNILGLHRNTIEITKDLEISKRADCIIGVKASKGCSDLSKELKSWIRSGNWMQFEIRTQNLSFSLMGRGSPDLDLSDDRELVLRKSNYISSRTMAINCSESAVDIPRRLIAILHDQSTTGELIIKSLSRRIDDDFVWNLP